MHILREATKRMRNQSQKRAVTLVPSSFHSEKGLTACLALSDCADGDGSLEKNDQRQDRLVGSSQKAPRVRRQTNGVAGEGDRGEG